MLYHLNEIDSSIDTIYCQVLLICVNYQSDEATIKFVRSALALRSSELLKIIVVNNGGYESHSILLNQFPADRVQIITTGSNLGYFGGASYGLKMFLENQPIPAWVVISNVDLEFVNSAFLDQLINYPVGHNLGILAPAIQSTLSNTSLNPFFQQRPNKWRMKLYKYMFRNYFLLLLYEILSFIKKKLDFRYIYKSNLQQVRKIYAPHGSFFIFSRQYFLAGGNLDWPMFLYNEEIFVAETARRIGLEIIYDPKLLIHHHDHVSTGIRKSRTIASHIATAAAYCAETYFD
jgi:GT2 family glycosyltransferase